MQIGVRGIEPRFRRPKRRRLTVGTPRAERDVPKLKWFAGSTPQSPLPLPCRLGSIHPPDMRRSRLPNTSRTTGERSVGTRAAQVIRRTGKGAIASRATSIPTPHAVCRKEYRGRYGLAFSDFIFLHFRVKTIKSRHDEYGETTFVVGRSLELDARLWRGSILCR